jgi:ATP-dependent DNA helicase RecG
LVEESENIEARAAISEYKRLSNQIFPDLELGLIHGRMNSIEKDAVMKDFRAGKMDILVSTSVVEVGIDVPNATVILIEAAERFGLSQLHQFRGRVGRGEKQSYCLLLSEKPSQEAKERLMAMEEIKDGFALAEKDMEFRGPGEFFGTRQSGLPDFRLAKITDRMLLEEARREAMLLYENDQTLDLKRNPLLKKELDRVWEGKTEWS